MDRISRAVGDYNWLPAFKDQRLGKFEGQIDGEAISASYEHSQEGQSQVAQILIRRESGVANYAMDARRSCIKVSASDTMRSIKSLQLGMSLISPATMPQDQAPASISPSCSMRG